MIGLILVTALDAFPDSLSISLLCAHAVFERWLGWSVGTNLPSCWLLKNKKNSPSTINNHLLFDVQTAYSWERDRDSVRVYKQAQRDTPPADQTLWKPTSNWPNWPTTFSKFANFYILIQDIGRVMSSGLVITSLTLVRIHCFYFLNQTCDKKWIYFFTFGFSCAGVLAWIFQFDLHFWWKISANLTVN